MLGWFDLWCRIISYGLFSWNKSFFNLESLNLESCSKLWALDTTTESAWRIYHVGMRTIWWMHVWRILTRSDSLGYRSTRHAGCLRCDVTASRGGRCGTVPEVVRGGAVSGVACDGVVVHRHGRGELGQFGTPQGTEVLGTGNKGTIGLLPDT